ncbi:hypothetical protein EWN99_10160 [Salmonella enterica]|nr:hypothetical protein [Salmonella enterica]ECI0413583.1 hypothetical protein [Salmonella enterica subsp. salamae]ECI4106333.1 hypothetical protein [Salmonella enterica subsp. salamae]EDW4023202.1 hypothetical protein [Salmonella enterica subsp. salamae]EFS9262030.1 hypothetical protein [Salmonella enterica]
MKKNDLKLLRRGLNEAKAGISLAGKRLNEGRLYKMLDTMRELTRNLNKLTDELDNIIEQQSSNV